MSECLDAQAKGIEARLAKLDEQDDKKQERVMRRMLGGGGADEEAAAAEEAAPAEEGGAAYSHLVIWVGNKPKAISRLVPGHLLTSLCLDRPPVCCSLRPPPSARWCLYHGFPSFCPYVVVVQWDSVL